MNTIPANIIVNSCEYTPVYVLESPNVVAQVNSLVTSQSTQDVARPVSESLKRFYENSGNIENCLNNVKFNVKTSTKPTILKKKEPALIKNNLKLANFLLPKVDSVIPVQSVNSQQTNANSIVLKPVVTTTNITNVNQSKINTVPEITFDRKIVKVTDHLKSKRILQHRTLPKAKPKEEALNTPLAKHTSVQLLKLGDQYHSLNQLSTDQMQIVQHALKKIKDPEKIPLEPTYDPVTNTRVIYRVVSAKDLTVVGKNKVVLKDNKDDTKKENTKKQLKETKQPEQITMTRSGRKVKITKQMCIDETPQKQRKKSSPVVNCSHCAAEFHGLHSLKKHNECHMNGLNKEHSNLFTCFKAIIGNTAEEKKCNTFIEQLEDLIHKLKALLPCMLKNVNRTEGNMCNVNDEVGRLFGMNPGQYNLNIEALNCIKDKDGFCKHNPIKNNQKNSDLSKPTQLWVSKNMEETACADEDVETEDCARINSVDKWPNISKKIWRYKQLKSQKLNAKRIRPTSENVETLIDLGSDDIIASFTNTNDQNDSLSLLQTKSMPILVSNDNEIPQQEPVIENQNINTIVSDQSDSCKSTHSQFYSTHFDIRSSPIKPTCTVFQKFQINPDKLVNNEVQLIRPLELDKKDLCDVPQVPHDVVLPANSENSLDLQGIFKDNMDLSCKPNELSHNLNFDTSKAWSLSDDQSHDGFLKSNGLVEPSLLHVRDDSIDKSLESSINQSSQLEFQSNSNQGSVLNFLDTLSADCLRYPETEIRNNTVDFNLDLFSFHDS